MSVPGLEPSTFAGETYYVNLVTGKKDEPHYFAVSKKNGDGYVDLEPSMDVRGVLTEAGHILKEGENYKKHKMVFTLEYGEVSRFKVAIPFTQLGVGIVSSMLNVNYGDEIHIHLAKSNGYKTAYVNDDDGNMVRWAIDMKELNEMTEVITNKRDEFVGRDTTDRDSYLKEKIEEYVENQGENAKEKAKETTAEGQDGGDDDLPF